MLGADGPNAWDCSSLVQAAYAAASIVLPRTADEQYDDARDDGQVIAGPPQLSGLQPGDLLFSPGSDPVPAGRRATDRARRNVRRRRGGGRSERCGVGSDRHHLHDGRLRDCHLRRPPRRTTFSDGRKSPGKCCRLEARCELEPTHPPGSGAS